MSEALPGIGGLRAGWIGRLDGRRIPISASERALLKSNYPDVNRRNQFTARRRGAVIRQDVDDSMALRSDSA
jgi:hypothetical protein